MNFNDIDEIKKAGFRGFQKMSELFKDSYALPREKGVYFVLYLDNKPPKFLIVGTGGHFKNRNPNVSIAVLKANWVENAIVVYIGKAGKDGSQVTLQKRFRKYIRFGKGKKSAHQGGRFIWQLKNYADLIVCWKTLTTDDPRTFEIALIQQFRSKFSDKLPFANLTN